MDALLILAGLLLFLSAFVWLVMRAFDTSLLWGWGSLIPPITLLFIFRKWSKARTPVILGGLALGTMIVGLAQMAASSPERVSDIFSLRWMHAEPAGGNPQIRLAGELNGQPFNPQTAELIDGVLTLREGQDFYARRELTIRLPAQPAGALKLDVLPQDRQRVPVIELNWLLPEQDLPEARRITRGYSLRLNLQPVAPNKLAGEFHLVLPARFKTSLSGELELYTDRLRYRDGKLDTGYDSRETLGRVIEDYLQRRFRSTNVVMGELPPIRFPSKKLALEVATQVNGQKVQLPLELEKDDWHGWRVANDRYPALPRAQKVAEPARLEQPDAPEQAEPRNMLDRRVRFSLQRLLLNPDNYQHLMMRVETDGGVTAQGRFAGISKEGDLIIRSQISGAGEATFNLHAAEVVNIELLEP